MGSLRRISLAGLFVMVAGGCVYVPPEIYYGRAPRPRQREYYVEQPPPPPEVWDERGPRYRDPEWERQQQLEREERRGYRDERNGRARTDRYEDRYARRDRDDDGGRESRGPRGSESERELEPEPRRQTPPPTTTPRREETVTRNESRPTQPEKKEVQTGTRTSNPNRVKSPYAPYNELDITGLKSGSLARDPTTGQVFRVP